MSYAATKLRIAARRVLDKADVELVYNELVRVVGGTTYLNGVSQGSGNGLLDWRNFSGDAGIVNNNKNSPNAIWAAQIHLSEVFTPSPPDTHIAYLPLAWDASLSATIIAWTLYLGPVSTGTNSATAKLKYVRNGVETQIGTTVTVTNAAGYVQLSNQTSLTVALQPKDILKLEWLSSTGMTWNDIVSVAWLKSAHVR